MKIDELIETLQNIRDCYGNVEVQAYSDAYCCDTHKIDHVQYGWWDGWREHDDVIGICITK